MVSAQEGGEARGCDTGGPAGNGRARRRGGRATRRPRAASPALRVPGGRARVPGHVSSSVRRLPSRASAVSDSDRGPMGSHRRDSRGGWASAALRLTRVENKCS